MRLARFEIKPALFEHGSHENPIHGFDSNTDHNVTADESKVVHFLVKIGRDIDIKDFIYIGIITLVLLVIIMLWFFWNSYRRHKMHRYYCTQIESLEQLEQISKFSHCNQNEMTKSNKIRRCNSVPTYFGKISSKNNNNQHLHRWSTFLHWNNRDFFQAFFIMKVLMKILGHTGCLKSK